MLSHNFFAFLSDFLQTVIHCLITGFVKFGDSEVIGVFASPGLLKSQINYKKLRLLRRYVGR